MLRPWTFVIKLDAESTIPIYLQIVDFMINEIKDGRLQPSVALPGTRELAERLAVNRKTVMMAYDELIAQGWLQTEKRRGTFVSSILPLFKPASQNIPKTDNNHVPDRGQGHKIEFNDGIPDSRLIPFEIISKAFRHALLTSARSNTLGYGDPQGNLILRKSIASMLTMERGLHIDHDNICIVRGSQMGLYITAKALLKPGDIVITERLSYGPARLAFESCGARVLTVDTDHDGLMVENLDMLCKSHPVRFVYVTPHHQFPTTVMMAADRRNQLLALARKHNFKILEDDYDHEFHYARLPVLPIASQDTDGYVIYIGSLSKVLAPGLRVGYLAGSKEFIKQCTSNVMIIDRQGNPVTELAAAELMNSGELKRHIRRTLIIYNQRRCLLDNLLKQNFSHEFSYVAPQGGLAFWLKLNPRLSYSTFLKQAELNGLAFSQGSIYQANDHTVDAIRLGFGSSDEKQMNFALAKLKLSISPAD